MKNCIISVAVRKPYTDYILRLVDSISPFHSNYNYQFWIDEYPPESRDHHSSLYGFKTWAFNWAFKQGYENVLWLDSPCYLLDDPYPIFQQIENDGHYLITGSDKLWKHVNNKTLKRYGLNREEVKEKDWRLLSGSFIGFNKGCLLNEMWKKAERDGMFMTAYEDGRQVKEFEGDGGHRHDESVLSCLAYLEGHKLTPVQESHFQNGKAIVKAEKW